MADGPCKGASIANYQNIFKKWIGINSDDALEAWMTLSESPERTSAGQIIIAELTERDPRKLLEYVDSISGFSLEQEGRFNALKAIAKLDLKEVMDYLADTPLGETKGLLVKQIVESLPNDADYGPVLSWIESAPQGELKYSAIAALIPRIGIERPDLAQQLLDLVSPGDERRRAVEGFAAKLSEAMKPEDALGWLGRYLDEWDSEEARLVVVKNWANTEPIEAVTYVEDNLGGNKTLLNGVLERWMIQNAGQAVEWIEQGVADGRISDNTVDGEKLFGVLAARDPVEASRIMNESRFVFEANEQNVSSVGFYWAKTDPVAATSWAQNLPVGVERIRAYSAIAEAWMAYDSMNASRWVQSLRNDASKDAAIVAIVNSMRGYDLKVAKQWAESISDSTLRRDKVEELGSK